MREDVVVGRRRRGGRPRRGPPRGDGRRRTERPPGRTAGQLRRPHGSDERRLVPGVRRRPPRLLPAPPGGGGGREAAAATAWRGEAPRAAKRGRPRLAAARASWSALPPASIIFLHWIGFDPRSALSPPNEETTQALGFLAYDLFGKIVEKVRRIDERAPIPPSLWRGINGCCRRGHVRRRWRCAWNGSPAGSAPGEILLGAAMPCRNWRGETSWKDITLSWPWRKWI